LPRCDASLAPDLRSKYVDGADGYIPGCVAFSLPVLRRNLLQTGIPAFFPASPEPAQRAADKEGRFRARAAFRSQVILICSRDEFDTAQPIIRLREEPICDRRRALWRRAGLSAQDQAAPLPPTFLDGPTLDAPDCVADPDPWDHCAKAHCLLAILFGPARRVAFWPSPHPRIRWTVASPGRARCAHRHTRPPPS
jgi:hypothetical protein